MRAVDFCDVLTTRRHPERPRRPDCVRIVPLAMRYELLHMMACVSL